MVKVRGWTRTALLAAGAGVLGGLAARETGSTRDEAVMVGLASALGVFLTALGIHVAKTWEVELGAGGETW